MTQGVPSSRGGLVSAVLLLVLLATSGLPVQPDSVAGAELVACQTDTASDRKARTGEREGDAVVPLPAAAAPRAPRLPHRQRRIDTGGMPPPRAPTR